MSIDLPKQYINIPELNDKPVPADGSFLLTLRFHREGDRGIIYNPLNSIQFDVDLTDLPTYRVGKVGKVRWDKLAYALYGNSALWYILAQLNEVIDPFSELPERKDLIYYIDPAVMNDIFLQLKY